MLIKFNHTEQKLYSEPERNAKNHMISNIKFHMTWYHAVTL